MIEDLKKLISFKTLTDNRKENKKALEWLKGRFYEYDLKVKDLEFRGYPSIVATSNDTKNPTIWLQAHVDVVPGSEELFTPKIKGDALIGRGAFDMKFAIACYLRLLEEIDLSKTDLGIMITSDEEVGGFNGVKAILDKGYTSEICFLPDGGEDYEIEKAAKGVWHLEVESRGKAEHGSRPWLGESAIEKLIFFLDRLRKEFPLEPCQITDHYHNTLNIGRIEGGEAPNQIADEAKAFLDIRFIPETGKEGIKKMLEDVSRYFDDIDYKTRVFGNAYRFDTENRYFKVFSSIVEDTIGREPTYGISHGSSDARHFADKGIPVILTRPRGGGQHSENEWIDIADMERYYKSLERFVKKILIDK